MTTSPLHHKPERDRAWGRFYGRRGAHRIIDRAGPGKCPSPPMTPRERVEKWRRQYATLTVEQTVTQVYRIK